jgi:hypothetical protein
MQSSERGDKGGSAVFETRKPETGISAGLPKKDDKPVYNLEYIGTVVDPAGKQPVSVEHGTELVVSGWAVDAPARQQAGGVDVVIDGAPYTAAYQLPRGDVADHFKVAAYTKAGFSLQTSAVAFGIGRHSLSIRVLTHDRKAYYEGLPVLLDIR